MWECPYAVCVCPVALVEELNLEVSMGHIFPQGLLAAITLVGRRLEMEGLEPEPGVR